MDTLELNKEMMDRDPLLIEVMFQSGLTESKGQGRRFIVQGIVQVNRKQVKQMGSALTRGTDCIIRVGKHKQCKIVWK